MGLMEDPFTSYVGTWPSLVEQRPFIQFDTVSTRYHTNHYTQQATAAIKLYPADMRSVPRPPQILFNWEIFRAKLYLMTHLKGAPPKRAIKNGIDK